MPGVTVRNSLATLLGERGRKAHEQSKAKPIQYGIQNLPAGINNGVAQLKTAEWGLVKDDKQNAGKPYVLLRGVAIIPVDHPLGSGVPVKGLGVMLTIPLYDTTPQKQPDNSMSKGRKTLLNEEGTLENWYACLLNEIRKFGIDTSRTEAKQIDGLLQYLQQQKPFYRFSTRGWTPPATPGQPKPTEMIFTQFDGVLKDFKPPAPTGTKDQTGTPAPSANGAAETAAPAAAEGGQQGVVEETQTEEPPFNEFEDLPSLAAAADADDSAAQNKLDALAVQAGLSEADIKGAKSWVQVVEMMSAANAEGETGEGEGEEGVIEEPPPAEPIEPTKASVWHLRPKGRDGKPVKKPVEVTVLSVNKKARTVLCKNLENTKIQYKDISWDRLESIPAE